MLVQSNKTNKMHICKDMGMISYLPDELIVVILSFLPLKEAGKTSVLSNRWRYIWTYLTDLDFDDSETLCFLYKIPEPKIKMNNYVNWVNRVLTANRTMHLNSLRIHFQLSDIFSTDINKWFDLAMNTKMVKNLELNLGTFNGTPVTNTCCIRRTSYTYGYKNDNLRSLSLVAVATCVKLLDNILADCPNLERLSLSQCSNLFHLKFVFSSHYKLKYLLIHCCGYIQKVELFAPNLTYFAFAGCPSTSIEYLHVPKVVEAAFGGLYCKNMLDNLQSSYSTNIMDNLHSLSSFSSQLEKLSLVIYNQASYTCSVFGAAFGNLKQLELTVHADYDYLCLTFFFEACPLLHTFKLKMLSWALDSKSVVTRKTGGRGGCGGAKTNTKLKAIEYVGFNGNASCVKLALLLTQLSPLLEMFVFHCRSPGPSFVDSQHCYEDWYTERVRLFSEAAQVLAKKIQLIKPVKILIM